MHLWKLAFAYFADVDWKVSIGQRTGMFRYPDRLFKVVEENEMFTVMSALLKNDLSVLKRTKSTKCVCWLYDEPFRVLRKH